MREAWDLERREKVKQLVADRRPQEQLVQEGGDWGIRTQMRTNR
jgi:hypothetical protein